MFLIWIKLEGKFFLPDRGKYPKTGKLEIRKRKKKIFASKFLQNLSETLHSYF